MTQKAAAQTTQAVNAPPAAPQFMLRRSAVSDAPVPAVPSLVHEVLRSPGQPLDAATRAYMEPRFGHDFSQVRVHTDNRAAASAHAVQARAYTVGHDVAFGARQYAPGTSQGRHLLAHELAHVAQQRAAPSVGDLKIPPPDDAAEKYAEAEADRTAQETRTTGMTGSAPRRSSPAADRRTVLYRYADPTGKTDPNAVIPVASLISYIEAVEKAYPKDTPTDVLTRIRNQYYSGVAFDQLIPDAHSSDIYSDWETGVTVVPRRVEKNKVGDDAYNHLTAHADENAHGDNPSPYIQTANGERIDLGHLLLGLDALLHPRTSIPYSSYGVSAIDVSSWVADLGIASVWMTQHEESKSPPSDAPRKLSAPNLDEYYKMSAPNEDLLGDADSFGTQDQWSAASGQTLSQVLRAYYLGQSGQAAPVQKRWQTFCAKYGFTYTRSGNAITWDAGLKAFLSAQINKFNDLYNAGSAGSAWGSTVGSPTHRAWPHTPEVVGKFLDFVKPRLEAELGAGSAAKP